MTSRRIEGSFQSSTDHSKRAHPRALSPGAPGMRGSPSHSFSRSSGFTYTSSGTAPSLPAKVEGVIMEIDPRMPRALRQVRREAPPHPAVFRKGSPSCSLRWRAWSVNFRTPQALDKGEKNGYILCRCLSRSVKPSMSVLNIIFITLSSGKYVPQQGPALVDPEFSSSLSFSSLGPPRSCLPCPAQVLSADSPPSQVLPQRFLLPRRFCAGIPADTAELTRPVVHAARGP